MVQMSRNANFHEVYRQETPERGSERSFGFVMTAGLLAVAVFPLIRGAEPRWVLLPLSAGFGFCALVAPALLRPFNWLWHRFGMVLQKIVNPVVMGVIFVIGVVPTGLILKAAGKDPMRRKFDPQIQTYWIARDPPGPPPETMKNQF
jgi:hypothetical protein